MRIISRLDIKNEFVVKGICFEGLRKIGDPEAFCKKYYDQMSDELLISDVVASLYGRNNLFSLIKKITEKIFIPVCLSGGIRNLKDIQLSLDSGADKVAINSEALKNPDFIKIAAEEVGSQAVVISIEAKKQNNNSWEAYYDNGRERSGRDIYEWVMEAAELGAGEILLTSIDKEGLKKGMDIDLLKGVREKVNVPIVFSGGVGKVEDIINIADKADGVAIASAIHYKNLSIKEIKTNLKKNNISVR